MSDFTLHMKESTPEAAKPLLDNSQRDAFYSAGYKHQQLLEIILILAQKVMSNYTNHLADTPVDEPFKKFDWSPK